MKPYAVPDSQELMELARQNLKTKLGSRGGRSSLASPSIYDDLGPAPEAFDKPVYGTVQYAMARKAGWITDEEEQGDREKFERKRVMSLQTAHRYSLYDRPRFKAPADTRGYVPELSARLENDRNITDGAKRCARKLAEIIYRQNREGRFTEITVTYLMEALGRSRRTIQRYLRNLEREGYISAQVIRSARARMCVGLRIALGSLLLAAHHKDKWPSKATNSGASRMSHNNRFLSKNHIRDAVSVNYWASLCMNGVFRSFMKTDPLGLSHPIT